MPHCWAHRTDAHLLGRLPILCLSAYWRPAVESRRLHSDPVGGWWEHGQLRGFLLKELDISGCDLPDIPEEKHGGGFKSEDWAPSTNHSLTGSPSYAIGRFKACWQRVRSPTATRPSPSLPQPASQLPATKALFQDRPDIIKMAADLRGIPMLEDPPVPAHDLSVNVPDPTSRHPLVWPCFTELCLSTWRQHFTKTKGAGVPLWVHQDTELSFPTVSPLDKSLATILLPVKGLFGGFVIEVTSSSKLYFLSALFLLLWVLYFGALAVETGIWEHLRS